MFRQLLAGAEALLRDGGLTTVLRSDVDVNVGRELGRAERGRVAGLVHLHVQLLVLARLERLATLVGLAPPGAERLGLAEADGHGELALLEGSALDLDLGLGRLGLRLRTRGDRSAAADVALQVGVLATEALDLLLELRHVLQLLVGLGQLALLDVERLLGRLEHHLGLALLEPGDLGVVLGELELLESDGELGTRAQLLRLRFGLRLGGLVRRLVLGVGRARPGHHHAGQNGQHERTDVVHVQHGLLLHGISLTPTRWPVKVAGSNVKQSDLKI